MSANIDAVARVRETIARTEQKLILDRLRSRRPVAPYPKASEERSSSPAAVVRLMRGSLGVVVAIALAATAPFAAGNHEPGGDVWSCSVPAPGGMCSTGEHTYRYQLYFYCEPAAEASQTNGVMLMSLAHESGSWRHVCVYSNGALVASFDDGVDFGPGQPFRHECAVLGVLGPCTVTDYLYE